jgi:hypothetical protein
MKRFLFVTVEAGGNIPPLLGIVRRLVARGHVVRVLGDRVLKTQIEGASAHAKKELEAYLDCGLLCRGFARLRCESCGESRLVAFACKGRGFCPSCRGRRMCATAANLVERVLPLETDLRQWVLTFPFAWRRRLAQDGELLGALPRSSSRPCTASTPSATARPARKPAQSPSSREPRRTCGSTRTCTSSSSTAPITSRATISAGSRSAT